MFEKAKLDTGKGLFKAAESKEMRGQYQDKSRGDKAIQLERLRKKSPEAYKKAMKADHQMQRVLRKVQDRNKKFEQKWKAKSKKDLRPVSYNRSLESSGNIQAKADKSVHAKMAKYEKDVIDMGNKKINAIGEKHGIDLGYGQEKEQSKDKSRT